jgi:hypothetical protein
VKIVRYALSAGLLVVVTTTRLAIAQEPVITNVTRIAGGLGLRWSSPTNRNIVAGAAAVAGDYRFVSQVLTSRESTVSNDAPSSFFRVQRVTVVYFPDTNLANGIRKAITNKSEPIAEFYDFETAAITNLDLVNKSITNIGGLEYTSLVSLKLSLNKFICDISPLTGLTSMTSLELLDNQITNLDALAGMHQLDKLHISQNQISDLGALSNLTSLTQLWIFDNQVSDISPLAGLTNLVKLLASDNLISNCTPLTELTRLQALGLENNAITNADALTGLTNLLTLYLTSNRIVEIGGLLTNSLSGGLGTGDEVRLRGNLLSDYAKTNDIPGLTNRGVIVTFDP